MTKQRVTLIGSFRKEHGKLESIYDTISSSKQLELLCPKSIDFVDQNANFVKAPHEINNTVNSIESNVLESIKRSDFVWLFAPNGYVGVSAAFEIGFAYSNGIPIYSDQELADEMLMTMIEGIIKSPDMIQPKVYDPGRPLSSLQLYYQKISVRRGWDNEAPRDILLLLTEEMGELAHAIRRSEGIKRDNQYKQIDLQDELADIQLYLLHMANSLRINLSDAVTKKEHKNEARFNKSNR